MSPMSEISSSISSTSTTAQRRKIKKPLIEKRRRLRINQCLASLKSLVLEATNKDENCFPKMEKADILEMTVAYMRTVRHHSSPISASSPPPTSAATDSSSEQARTYLSGYRECAMEVCRFFTDDDCALPVGALPVGVPEVRAQLTRHLSGCFQRIQLDLQSIVVDRSMHHGQLQLSTTTTTTAGGMERERAGNNKRRCTEEDRLPSPSSSSSSSHSSSFSSSSSPIPFSSSVPIPSPSNHAVTDIPRNLVSMSSSSTDPSINPTQFTSVRRVDQLISFMHDSKPPQSMPATSASASSSASVFSSVLQPSSRPKMIKQTPRHAQHQQHQHLRQSSLLSQQHQPHHQQQQHQQQDALPFQSPQHCLSPKRGDEFPAAAVVDATKTSSSSSSRHSPLLTTPTSTPTTIAMVNPRPIIQSTCIGSRTNVAFFEPLPTNAEDPSLVWRPW